MTKPPLDAITRDGVANLLGHNKTHPGALGWILVGKSTHVHDDARRARSDPGAEGAGEITGPSESPGPGQHWASSARETGAALATTISED